MGYEYDLINDFAKSQGLKLNIKVAENPARLIEMLEAGEVDVVAYPIPINNKLKQEVIYCGREDISSQVLIQRANKGDKLLTDVTQLIDKNVYVKPNTKYSERLKTWMRNSAEESISKKWKMTPLLPKILSRWSPWAKFPIRSAMITPPA